MSVSINLNGIDELTFDSATAALTAPGSITITNDLGLGTMAYQNANDVDITGGTIDGTTGVFLTSLQAGGSSTTPGSQGNSLQWNLSEGTGESNFVNYKGGGVGGWSWINLASGTTGSTAQMTLTPSGNLVCAGSISATTEFSGPGTGLTGTATSLSIGGNAATATLASEVDVTTSTTNEAYYVAIANYSSILQSSNVTANPATGVFTATSLVLNSGDGGSVTFQDGTVQTTAASGVANVTVTIGTSTITSYSSAGPTVVSMPGLTTGMTLNFTPAEDVSGVVGWEPSAEGQLYFIAWPSSAGHFSYYVCNSTNASIVPSASTVWNVSAH